MLIYVLDAFNVVHAVPGLADSPTPRADLLAHLKHNRLTGSRTNRTVVIFDGYPAEGVDGEREVEVIFSKNRTADDAIREFLEKAPHKRQIVVVSDDHAVRDAARSEGARPMSNAEFLQRKAKVPKKKARGDEESIDGVSRDRITQELKNLWIKK